MAKLTLPHIHSQVYTRRRKSDGVKVEKTYYYYRRGDHPRMRLPGAPFSPEFMARWHDLEAGAYTPTAAERVVAGTVHDLIAKYKQSEKFQGLKPRTKSDYVGYMDVLLTDLDDIMVVDIELATFYDLQEKYSATPRKANFILGMLRILMKFAKRRGIRKDNPAEDLEMLKGGQGFKAWTEADVVQFLQSAPPATMRRALMLALYTGQRRGDVIQMTWGKYDGEFIQVTQEKGEGDGAEEATVWIPAHKDLKAEMDLWPRQSTKKKGGAKILVPHRTILVSARSAPWNGRALAHEFQKAVENAGLRDPDEKGFGLSLHGLRKLAVSRLLDAGCSVDEVMAITGHKTDTMVRHYDKQASKKPRAKAAILKLESRKK
jgi:integrase